MEEISKAAMAAAVERWRMDVKCNSGTSFGKALDIAPQTATARAAAPGKLSLDNLKRMDKIENLTASDIKAILGYIGLSEKRILKFAENYIKNKEEA